MKTREVLVIGGGVTGVGIARDLAMRGVEVLLLERNDFSAGATGRSHGMLHSGGRYAVNDPDSARECASECSVLKRIAPFCIEDTGGMFIGIDPGDVEYLDRFLGGCQATGVGAGELTPREAFGREPLLNERIQVAVDVPDAYVDPFFLAQGNVEDARGMGAEIRNHCEIVGMRCSGERVEEVTYRDHRKGDIHHLRPELVVNATGAWAGRIADMAGLSIPLRVDKGSLVVLNGRTVNGLINRLRPPSDGDIIVPSHSSNIIGTTCREVASPDDCRSSMEEVRLLISQAAEMVPTLAEARAIRAYAGIRPLPADSDEGRNISRTFRLIDHGDEGIDNLISIVGGKLTTYRLMAERATDMVMRKLGRRGHCRTMREEIVAPCAVAEGVPPLQADRIARKYGWRCDEVIAECAGSTRGGETLCSCEQVMRGEAQYFCRRGDVMDLTDLMRRTRAGMGYCQSGLCMFRMLSVVDDHSEEEARSILGRFISERWKGVEPVLFGTQLRQEAFKMYLSSVYSLDGLIGGEPDEAR